MDETYVFVMVLAIFVVVIPVVLGVSSDMLKRWLAHKEKAMELMAADTAEKAAQYAAKVQGLEQRMRVLERIATDRGNDLALEIEDLRDPTIQREKLQ